MTKISNTILILHYRRVRLAASIVLLVSLASCGAPSYNDQPATKVHVTQTVPTFIYTVTAVPDLVTSVLSPTPMPINLSVTQIRVPNESDGRMVLTAFWSRDGKVIYYALVNEISDIPLWFEISVVDGQNYQNKQASSQPRLTYTPLLPIGGLYLEYQGLVSPSERYRFQITKSDNYSLHLLDSIEQNEIELLTSPDMNFRGAYWMPNENSVVFGIGPEYGTFLYLYDIQDRKLSSFDELLNYTAPNISEWALSPDGKYIAILGESLKLFSLDGSFSSTVSSYLSNVRWAGNSQKVYYYSGTQLYDPTNIGYFDMTTKTAIDVVSFSTLEKLGVDIGFFDVSPNGNQLVIWQAGDIWLLSFR